MADIIDEIDRKATDLGDLMREISEQFQTLNAGAACQPSMELSIQEFRVVEHIGKAGPRHDARARGVPEAGGEFRDGPCG